MSTSRPDKYVLITNLDYVTIGPVRTHCDALLLDQPGDLSGFGQSCKVRGFGPDPAWDVFDYFLRDLTEVRYTLEGAESQGVQFIGASGVPGPLMRGAILRIEGGPQMDLVTRDSARPLRVEVFEGAREERVVLRVWEVLKERVRQYRHPDQYMPSLVWGPP